MNFKLKTSLIIGAIVASSLVYAATVLSPNQNNNSGSIPSGYSDLEFNLANGNWVKNLTLPTSANNLDKITIRSSAAYSSYLDTSNTNIPLEVLKINSGDVYQFIFNSSQNRSLNNSNPSSSKWRRRHARMRGAIMPCLNFLVTFSFKRKSDK